jgi:hypothetical protein
MKQPLKLRPIAASIFVGAIAGCTLLVTGDVPAFHCMDTASACPPGLRCDTATMLCVASVTVPPVEAGQPDSNDAPYDAETSAPDAADGAVVPANLGSKCRLDDECKSGLCASSTELTTAITATTGPICTTPCCTSEECPSSFVCFNGGTGGSYCVPAALAQRTPADSGGKAGGTSCSGNSECRSGLCAGTTTKTCLDTCCVASNCASPSTCRLKTVSSDTVPATPSHVGWSCALPETTATKSAGEACNEHSQCKTDACTGFGAKICRPACSNSASCKAIPGFGNGHCLYGSSVNDWFKFCFSETVGTNRSAGTTCSNNSECQSDYCDAELKRCANVCSKDVDCATDEVCRPSAVSTPYLRCVKR